MGPGADRLLDLDRSGSDELQTVVQGLLAPWDLADRCGPRGSQQLQRLRA
jgi:hypothetical protein